MRLPEPIANKMRCWSFNRFPCYRGTGGRLKYVAPDWSEVRIELPLSRRTRNYVGTIFGGSLYGSVDPIYMIMLIHRLGPEYIVWDKAPTIQFKKPGKETLRAPFVVVYTELPPIPKILQPHPPV